MTIVQKWLGVLCAQPLDSPMAAGNTFRKAKKRKSADAGLVEGFRIFKGKQTSPKVEQTENKANPPNAQARVLEEAAVIRKKYRIRVKGSNVSMPLKNFGELKNIYGCKRYIYQRLADAGYQEPTPIQRQAIPLLAEHRECFACAPTGSGKTLAFMLPILINLKVANKEGIRAVILCPTRELAAQITREFRFFIRKRFRIRLLTKALAKCGDFRSLPCDIMVATPLRLNRLLRKKRIDLSRVEYLILDESDKLFELGFMEQIDSVVNACSNPNITRALFSATLPDTVEDLARSIMHDAVRIVIGEKNMASQTVKQKLLFVGSEEGKLLALRQFFKESFKPPILLFVQSKERAKELHKELAYDDVKVDSIHADRTQAQRDRAVEMFREGKTWVLISTDLMARGMDFKGVNCVVNYDFPLTISTYIHRIGRSGRAGRQGEALTLYTEDDAPYLRSIVNVMKASGCEVPTWMLSLPKAQKCNKPIKRSHITK